MGSYRKIIEEGTFEHRFYEALGFPPVSDGGGAPLVLRITLGDMELLNGFYTSLPSAAGGLSIGDAIRKYVLCEGEEERIKVKRKLSRDPNPDLVDIYDALLYLYDQAEAGEVTLSYHINNGASDIQPTDPVSLHGRICTVVPSFPKGEQSPYSLFEEGERSSYSPFEKGDRGISADGGRRTYKLLDLVLEVYDSIDPFSGLTDEQKDAMLRDFRGIFVLYLMDKLGYQPNPQDGPSEVSSLLEYLASEDVGFVRIEGQYSSITPRGHDLLNSVIDEAEFYIDNYDIFGDVYVKGVSEIRFNAGYGDNLIVPVFMREGIDPYRALFIVALYLGNMDDLASDLAMLFSEDPFKELFSLIACSTTEEDIGTELLDSIIREGRLKVEERQLREARLKHIESIEQRVNNQ